MTQPLIHSIIILVVVVVIGFTFTCEAGVGTTLSEYDRLCDRMLHNAKLATHAHNVLNDNYKVAQHIDDVMASYHAAVALKPDEPQAYVHMGVFLYNTQRFEEALLNLTFVERLLLKTGATSVGMVQQKIKECLFGRVSVERDRTYMEGAGNITRTITLVTDQLRLKPHDPVLLHELGTVKVMRSFSAESAEDLLAEYTEAVTILEEAMNHSLLGFSRLQSVAGKHGPCAAKQQKLMKEKKAATGIMGVFSKGLWPERYRWKSINNNDNNNNDNNSIYVYHVPRARLHGDAAVVVPFDRCQTLVPSNDRFIDMSTQVPVLVAAFDKGGVVRPQVHEPYRQFPDLAAHSPKTVPSAVAAFSLVQYHSNTFYHWMCESLLRLVAAKESFFMPLPAAAEEKRKKGKEGNNNNNVAVELLVPADGTTGRIPSFVRNSLKMFPWLQDLIEVQKIVKVRPYAQYGAKANFMRLMVDDYFTVMWPPADAPPPHALGPHALIRRLNEELRNGVKHNHNHNHNSRPSVVVARRGRNVSMRTMYETENKILSTLLNEQQQNNALFDVIDFSTDNKEFKRLTAARDVFSKATVIIGVHGGALSNLVFATPSPTTWVIELGRADHPAARHYRNIAEALLMRYTCLSFALDGSMGRGLSAPNVTLEDEAALDKVLQEVVEHLIISHHQANEKEQEGDE
eukprot:PhM_4_TR6748/c1_g1_i1/m.16183